MQMIDDWWEGASVKVILSSSKFKIILLKHKYPHMDQVCGKKPRGSLFVYYI